MHRRKLAGNFERVGGRLTGGRESNQVLFYSGRAGNVDSLMGE